METTGGRDTEHFKHEVVGLAFKVESLETAAKETKEIRTLLHKLDMDVARIDTKLKITWYFLTLIITGIIGIAFSLWQGLGA